MESHSNAAKYVKYLLRNGRAALVPLENIKKYDTEELKHIQKGLCKKDSRIRGKLKTDKSQYQK